MAFQDNDDFMSTSIDDDKINVGCDESKCVSWGRYNEFNHSFTCYGNDTSHPALAMKCADGFLPVVVEGEPSTLHKQTVNDIFYQFYVSYFTCCPPYGVSSNTTANEAARYCSDPIPFTSELDSQEDASVDGLCDNHDQKNARRMKSQRTRSFSDWSVVKTDSFTCCDFQLPSSNEDASFLDKLQCVPYRNEFYEAIDPRNEIGLVGVISCDFPEGSFTVPQPLDGQTYTDVMKTGRYQCCKSGSPLQPYIVDGKFKITVYLPLALFSVAAVASAVVVIALLIPLFLQMKNGSFWTSKRSRKGKPRYSTYNLYVVYLAFFDLMYSLLEIGIFWSMVSQTNPILKFRMMRASYIGFSVPILNSWNFPITWAYININMWINCIISYRLLCLLQKSSIARRTKQLSLRKVNIQVSVVLLLSMVYYAILHILRYLSVKAELAGEVKKFERIATAITVVIMANVLLPLFFLCGITFWIWWGGYLPSARGQALTQSVTNDNAVRQLFFFFLRIILIFLVIWIPCLLLPFRFGGTYFFDPEERLVICVLSAVQPILSTCMVMTKYDSRKYIFDLISLSYCCGAKRKDGPKKIKQTHIANSGPSGETHIQTNHASIDVGGQERTSNSCANREDNGNENDAESGDDSDFDGLRFSIFGPDEHTRASVTFRSVDFVSDDFRGT